MIPEEDKEKIREGSKGGASMHHPIDPRKTKSVRFKQSTIREMDKLINNDRSLSYGGIVRLALDRYLAALVKK